MRALTLMILLALASLASSVAPLAQAAGLQLIDIGGQPGQRSIAGAIWTPCAQAPQAMRIGRYPLMATRDCALDGSARLPLVVISHGWGGTFLGHHDVAETLADAGFVVVAINHGDSANPAGRNQDFSVLVERPQDIRRTLDFMLNDWPQAARIDSARIGFFGFSRGGYTGLVAVGANPVFGPRPGACEGKRDQVCQQLRDGQLPPLAHDARIRAAVIADPLSLFFTGHSLDQVRVPIQLWSSEQGGDGVAPESVQAIADTLAASGTPVEYHRVPRSQHFSFLPPCPPEVARQVPELCADAPGFDRAAFHRQLDAAVLAFFQARLPVAP